VDDDFRMEAINEKGNSIFMDAGVPMMEAMILALDRCNYY
jgi:hypothetical protein